MLCFGMPSVALAERPEDRAPGTQPADPAGASAEQALADRYAPVVYLREISTNFCNSDTEGFDPVPVNFVLGRDDIPLLESETGQPTGRRITLAEEPQPSDLYGLGAGTFLDYPGSPLAPGCTYRRYFATRDAAEEIPRVAYAHIYLEPGKDELALQYWMYYYFNDWNNNHEGDWEMVMLFFDATTVEQALSQEPTRVVYAQHGGGERADWDAEILSKEDGHPVVYSARGAHASFFEQHVYLGLAENGTGFGCETTRGPHRRFELDAIVVPHEPSGPDDPFAWLAFDGRWGEFRRSEWNGPTGPNDKTSWTQPVTWAERQRDDSLIVPQFSGFGQAPIDFFCGAVSLGSRTLVLFTRAPMLVGLTLGLTLVAAGWVLTFVSASVRQALSYYRRHARVFLPLGAALIPIGYLVALLQTVLFEVPPIEPFLNIVGRFPGVRIALILMLGSVHAVLALIFVAPAVVWSMTEIRAGRVPRASTAFREGLRAFMPIFVARLRVAGRVVVRAITIVGIPWAVLAFFRGIFIPQAVIQDGDDARDAILDSARAANVNIPRAALTQVTLTIITLLTGPLLAIVLLAAIPSRPLGLVNYVSSITFSLLYPLSAIGMTLLYLELRKRATEATTDAAPPETAAGD